MTKPSKHQDPATSAESGHIRAKALAKYYSVSRSTIWRWVRTGRLPKPHKLSEGVTAWRKAELQEMDLM